MSISEESFFQYYANPECSDCGGSGLVPLNELEPWGETFVYIFKGHDLCRCLGELPLHTHFVYWGPTWDRCSSCGDWTWGVCLHCDTQETEDIPF